MSKVIDLRVIDFLKAVDDEFRNAAKQYPEIHSGHEAESIIREEMEEFAIEVRVKQKHRSRERMKEELIQLAAMCLRTYHDVVCEQGRI